MSGITTHVLDTARGRPAAELPIWLEHLGPAGWTKIGEGRTDADGRLRSLTGPTIAAGEYRLYFDTGAYFRAQRVTEAFYPEAVIHFVVTNPSEHFHVPLLMSPWSYSTYRGS
jgi:5-hydroxyisourate hydrolase